VDYYICVDDKGIIKKIIYVIKGGFVMKRSMMQAYVTRSDEAVAL
jgi:hypothetical protein